MRVGAAIYTRLRVPHALRSTEERATQPRRIAYAACFFFTLNSPNISSSLSPMDGGGPFCPSMS